MTHFPKAYSDAVAKMRVPFGFLMVAAFIWFSKPTIHSLWYGLPIAFGGILLRAWATGHLEKNQQLAVSGPYTFVRNPLYVGTLLAAAGFATASRQWWLGVLFAAVFLLIYLPVIELEEEHLRKLFPSYEDYCERVPMLLPRWRKNRAKRRFRFSLYRQNEEYNALLGFLAGAGVLLWKALR
jgi:protein-S-isoprenylcysteine O-methyltransferase Ste14